MTDNTTNRILVTVNLTLTVPEAGRLTRWVIDSADDESPLEAALARYFENTVTSAVEAAE
jgi:hypothetical protein